ncbi:MAG: hypothetical protein EZS28_025633, partial [Streblomastix strix]
SDDVYLLDQDQEDDDDEVYNDGSSDTLNGCLDDVKDDYTECLGWNKYKDCCYCDDADDEVVFDRIDASRAAWSFKRLIPKVEYDVFGSMNAFYRRFDEVGVIGLIYDY